MQNNIGLKKKKAGVVERIERPAFHMASWAQGQESTPEQVSVAQEQTF